MSNIKEKLLRFNKNKYVVLINLIFFAVCWFIFTHITKLFGDDLLYKNFLNDQNRPITNFKDVLEAQYIQYFIWGGRTVANILSQSFLLLPKIYFDICNAIIFTLTIYLIYTFRKNKEHNVLLIMFIFLSFWFFCGDLFRVFIWQNACFNYGWLVFLSLIFVKVYFLGYENNKPIDANIIICILFFIYSFITGWGHEVISPTVILSVFFYLLYKLVNKKHLSKLEIFGFIGYCIGTAFLLFAPGNFIRLKHANNLFNRFRYFPFSVYIVSILRNAYYSISFTTPLIITTILVLLAYINKCKELNAYIDYEKWKIRYCVFLLIFSNFFSFIMLAYANSILIIPLIIMLIIIERYVDYSFIDNYIEYFYIIIFMLMLLFFNQGIASVYYVVVKGKHIEHFYNIVV